MADDIDHANDLVQNAIARAVEEIRKNNASPAAGTKFCIECDDPMPAGRTKMGYKRCVPCTEDMERKKHLYAD